VLILNSLDDICGFVV